ncbi:MAG: hypothetical protein MRY32_03905, partial [Rickettsiales bacterium]|nr:hypothetical protein [Rickettsiales bacterium]
NDPTLAALFGRAQVTSVATSTTMQDTVQVPPKIAAMPMGSLLKGFVINRDAHNNPVLRTDYGDITVKSDVFLKTGSEVVLRLQQQQSQVMAKIISVNGTPIEEVAKQQNLISQQGSTDSVTRSAISSGQINNQALITNNSALQANMIDATLLQPSAVVKSPETLSAMLKLPPQLAQSLTTGASLQFRVISSDLPANQHAALMSAKTPATFNGSNAASLQSYQKTMQMDNPAARGSTQPLSGNATATASIAANPNTSAAQTPTNPATLPTNQQMGGMPTTNQTTQTAPPNIPGTPQSANAQPLPATPNTPTPNTSAQAPQAVTSQPIAAQNAPVQNTPVQNASDAIRQVVQDNIMASRAASSSNKQPIPQTGATSSLSSTQPANTSALSPNINVSSTKAGVITATVIGTEPNGETIVRTPIGTIRLATSTPPAINSVFQLELVVTPQMLKHDVPVSNTTVSMNQLTVTDLMKHWESLKDLQQVITQNPAFAAELTQRIPNTKSAMINSTLFFMSALQSGDLRRWLGNSNQQLIDDKAPALLKKLGLEINTIRMANDLPDQPWTMMSIPLIHEEEMHQWRLYLRHDEQAKNHDESGHRFVIDVEMSQLGPIQLDGLTRYKDKQLQFDLIVRSTEPLDATIKQEIRQIFADTAEITKYKGDIKFQHSPEHFIRPLEDFERHAHAEDGSIIA